MGFLDSFGKRYDVDNTLFVVTVIYNPFGFESRYKLYNDFKKYLDMFPDVKLLTVEIAHNDRPFKVTKRNNKWNVQLRSSHALWHKEAGINVGFARVLDNVPDAKYGGWFDADIKFSNPQWPKDTIKALQHWKIVQPFSQAHNLNAKYESMWKCESALYKYHTEFGYHQNPPRELKYCAGGHPGLAWAARIQTILDLGGLLDTCVAGSGDTHMLNALMGDVTLFMKPTMPQPFKDSLHAWAKLADEHVKHSIGFVHGMCMHYWHGHSEKRGYEKRWDIMAYHKFDPYVDIVLGNNGLYEFAGNKPELEADLKRSSASRDEDDNSYAKPYK